jgi:cyclase
MRRVGQSSYTEVYFPGCNPSFVATKDGVVLIDTPQHAIDAVRWKERCLEFGPIKYIINTEPHGDHVLGNAFFPGVEVVGQRLIQDRFDFYIDRRGGEVERVAHAKLHDPDSVWLLEHPDYVRKPPTKIFEDRFDLDVGDHLFHCIHMPGHTAPQTTVFVPQDGVIFTGDNVFCGCKTWLQEADPWLWLASLDRIGKLDAEVIVPGHGEPCTKAYLQTQAQIIHNWLGTVERMVDAGMTEEDAAAEDLAVRRDLDPYPIGQRLFPRDEDVTVMNVRNLHRVITQRKTHPDAADTWNPAALPVGFQEAPNDRPTS